MFLVDILDGMLAGIGRTLKDYAEDGEEGYNSTLPNSHRIFVHEKRRVALQSAIAMAKGGDIVVSFFL